MAEVIRMPRMSDTMTEGVIVEWHKKVGDAIEPGDLLAEVETDKATMELESYQEGTLLHIGVDKGAAVPVEGVIAVLGEKGEDFEDLLKEEPPTASDNGEAEAPAEAEGSASSPQEAAPTPSVAEEPTPALAATATAAPAPAPTNGRMKISPLARKMAEEKGIDVNQVQGTGDDGRIVKRDIEAFVPGQAGAQASPIINLPAVVGEESFEDAPVSQMRKTIARRLGESKFTAPHFYLTMEMNMDKAIEARAAMNEVSPAKISFNDMVIKAAAMALRAHPKVNASWIPAADGGQEVIRYYKHIHIGMAVAVEDGLVVPVLRFADSKSMAHIAAESRANAEKAINKQIQPEDMAGNTFTVSNLGMFDIDEFTAIINSPDACILAVGKIKQIPGVVDGEIKPVNVMKVTLSCDHRVVDGASGAKFLKTFKSLLEEPVRLLV